ncbi:MAG: hypothetical protein JNL05_02730 [Flavobacteriales bacterium]|nr:hypothetical protein [Flavobacteriales bacterium]
MSSSVTITEDGRSGQVIYREGLRSITGYWEFGGNDVVTIVNMGSRADWERAHGWALERRAAILRFVADEAVRQRAPSCSAEIDAEKGDILLRQGAGSASALGAPARAAGAAAGAGQAKAEAFVRRYSNLKAMVALGVLVVALVIGGALWLGKKALSVSPVSGVPLNECVRTDAHIASLIQTTDPHLVEISGRGGNTTTSLSILLIPLDGSDPYVVPVVKEVSGNGYSLARILGSDGRTLWFDCMGLYGVRLRDRRLVEAADLREANPGVEPRWWEDPRGADIVDGRLHLINDDRSAAMDVDPDSWKATPVAPKPSNDRFQRHGPTDHLASGLLITSGSWLGLHAPEELERDFKVGQWVRRVENAEDARRERRLFRATLEPGSDTAHFRIRSIVPLSDSGYVNAAFLRLHAKAEPLRLTDPESVLMVHTDKPGLGGRLVVSRLDLEGKVLWRVDTGLDRFSVSQILPGADAFAFVGTRPPVEGKLSEPLVVLVDNATGRLTVHSLWR